MLLPCSPQNAGLGRFPIQEKPMGEYKPGDRIDRKSAAVDLWADFTSRPKAWLFNLWDLVKDATDIFTDVFVNLARIAGVSDRDNSQRLGRFLAVAAVLVIVSLVFS